MKTVEPVRETPLGSMDDSRCKKSKVNISDPKRAKENRKMAEPKCAKARTDIEDPMVMLSDSNTNESRRTLWNSDAAESSRA